MKPVALAALLALPAFAEELVYRAEWRVFDAGEARIEMKPGEARLDLKTHGVVGKLHPVEDRYRAEYRDGHCVTESRMEALEGDDSTETVVKFEAGMARLVETDRKRNRKETAEVAIPPCVHDVIGALGKLRELRLAPGAEVKVPLSDGRKSIQARVAAHKSEQVKTPAGMFRAVRHEAFLYNGAFYRRKGRLFVWLTDDERRLPVQVKVELPFYIGDVTLKLEKVPGAEPDSVRTASLRR